TRATVRAPTWNGRRTAAIGARLVSAGPEMRSAPPEWAHASAGPAATSKSEPRYIPQGYTGSRKERVNGARGFSAGGLCVTNLAAQGLQAPAAGCHSGRRNGSDGARDYASPHAGRT